ncbi:hypothetical protein ACIBP6_40180 [Nonomuraea terrae]|uniref:hypothetical protein n=1 Tax=Nonomuraea terrae TaxID=2530383 RepID=UPI0026874BD6
MVATMRRQYSFHAGGFGAHLLEYVVPFISQPSTMIVSAPPPATSLWASSAKRRSRTPLAPAASSRDTA